MNMKIFCVFDSKVGAFMQPFFMQSKGAAIRGFSELVNDKTHSFGKYPSDFTLFELGSWSDQDAKFVQYATPDSLGIGIEFVRSS